jgi:acyl dehydratase
MTEIDRSLIGSCSEPYEFEIERGAIRKFALAIGDANPLYFDADFACRYGYADVVAPPTFPTCLRLPKDPAWIETLDRRRIMAGEMSFSYELPITAGMRITCRMHLVGVDRKQGRRGAMDLIRQETRGHDQAGRLVFVAGRTTVYRSLEQVEKRSLA